MKVLTPPPLDQLFGKVDSERLIDAIQAFINNPPDGVAPYLHWDKLRHLKPPDGLTTEEWWFATKLARGPLMRRLPLEDSEGQPFTYALVDEVLQLLHYVDQRCSGEIAMPEVVTADEQAKRHYLVNSLMEEAIRSSQLEGATTSRRVAMELLRTGRRPKNRSEKMILNNYRALQFMRESVGSELTANSVLELQRVLTEGTLDDPGSAGRLRTSDDDRVAVFDISDGSLIHRPPPADQLPDRLNKLCEFANTTESAGFMHPVVRAILLHFWLAYDHPFEDGNGRTARALFYWSMRTQSYWLVEYLSISRILRNAPAKYARAFLYTETDDRDTTYFLIYQLEVIARAIDELHKYLRRKVGEIREVEKLMKRSEDFNQRQLALLSDAVRNPERVYTFDSHAAIHSVTHETARTDLLDLERRGLVTRRTIRRKYFFSPIGNLGERLKNVA